MINLLRFLFRWLPWLLAIGLLFLLFTGRINWFKQEVAPADSVTHQTLLTEVEQLGKLELVRYRLKDVVEIRERNEKYLGFFDVPDSKVLLVTVGEAVGCIDLTQLGDNDILIAGDTVLVRLPKPELCYYKLDLENSKVYSLEKQVYFKEESKLLEKAYKQAERQMRRTALQTGILDQASQNAELILRPLLEKTSGKTVLFTEQLPEQDVRLN